MNNTRIWVDRKAYDVEEYASEIADRLEESHGDGSPFFWVSPTNGTQVLINPAKISAVEILPGSTRA